MAHDNLGIQYDTSIYFMVAKTTDHGDIMRICITYGGSPQMGDTPSVHPFKNGIFPCKPSIFGYLHLWKIPNISSLQSLPQVPGPGPQARPKLRFRPKLTLVIPMSA